MKMFDINKFCNDKNNCKNEYSRKKTATVDPTITRKMRYSQITRNQKYKHVRTYNMAQPVTQIIPTEFYPKGQIFSFPLFN
jgi:hypothetical protein